MNRAGIKKHAVLFSLWLHGADIEFRNPVGVWVYLSSPSWRENDVYRIRQPLQATG